jgi:alpha,alpha-trehalase
VEADVFQRFMEEYFEEAGSDLVEHVPSDYRERRAGGDGDDGFVPGLRAADQRLRAWAQRVHGVWPQLSRSVSPAVALQPGQHTLLPLPHPVIVPGSRFREVYYWDTYWIIRYPSLLQFLSLALICLLSNDFPVMHPVGTSPPPISGASIFCRGLIISKMLDTAKGMVENLLHLVKVYGFVLNGARAYYENRRFAQPPLLLGTFILSAYGCACMTFPWDYPFFSLNRLDHFTQPHPTYYGLVTTIRVVEARV